MASDRYVNNRHVLLRCTCLSAEHVGVLYFCFSCEYVAVIACEHAVMDSMHNTRVASGVNHCPC